MEETATLTKTYCIHYTNVVFSGEKLKRSRENTERSIRDVMKRITTIQSKMDRWQLAMEWAREHGAKIRKGKVSKHLARVRIYEAGLMDGWNEQFPELAFDVTDVEQSREFLRDREDFYSKKKKHRKN